MKNRTEMNQRTEILFQATSFANLSRMVSKSLAGLALAVALFSSNEAKAQDSFFDVYVNLMETGAVVMESVNSAEFPFPPPPLNFDPVPTSRGTFDTEIVSMSLASDGLVVWDPSATGAFQVDSFFDVFYEINLTDQASGAEFNVDSFFDVSYSMLVTPLGEETAANGDRTQTWDTEILSMDLMAADLFGDPDFITLRMDLGNVDHRGHVTVLKRSDTGTFNVDSFFDVFVELSLEGSVFSPPIEVPGGLHLQSSLSAVPEPTSFIMFGSLGLLFVRKRRKVHPA